MFKQLRTFVSVWSRQIFIVHLPQPRKATCLSMGDLHGRIQLLQTRFEVFSRDEMSSFRTVFSDSTT